ncbi:hypothetical protein TKK_0012107 [Trichogramma kaykai]
MNFQLENIALTVDINGQKALIANKEEHGSGEEYSDSFGSWKTVMIHAEMEISLREQFAKVDTAENKIHFSSGTACSVQKTIDNSNGTIYPVVYTLSTPESSFSLAITGQLDLCGHTVLRSEHPQLFIYETNRITFASLRILINNIDPTACVNSKFVYVEKVLSVGMEQMNSDILHKRCELEKMILRNSIATASYAPDIFAYHLMQEPSHMTVLTS